MRILYTIGRYWPAIGGAELYTRGLTRELARRHSTMVVCLRNDSYRDEWLYGWTVRPQKRQAPYRDGSTEVRVIRLGLLTRMLLRKRLENYYSDANHRTFCKRMLAVLFLKKLEALRGPFDVVHNIFIGEEFFSLASLAFARARKIPFVFTPVSHPDGWKGELFSELYRSADGLIAMTEAEKGFLISQGGRPNRTHVVGSGPFLEGPAAEQCLRHRPSPPGPVVLFLGQKIHYKGIPQVLDAAELVWARHPTTVFVFAGPRTAYSEDLFARRSDPRIVELGTLSDEEKAGWLSACDIFCLPSICESFGIVYLEAWTYRKPVIAADTPVSRCLISHGHDGLLVKQDAPSIAAALVGLLENSALRATLGENGHAKVTSCYAWPVIASQIESIYHHNPSLDSR